MLFKHKVVKVQADRVMGQACKCIKKVQETDNDNKQQR